MGKRVILITSGQPSLNPRLVKEADALIEVGYDVSIIYQFWNAWGTELDESLLKEKKWKAIRVGGDPINEKITYWKTRITFKIAQKLVKIFGFKKYFAELAIGRCTLELLSAAKNSPADLYIAHNLAALPVAVFASKYHQAKCGFDAEDLHRYEMSDDDSNQDVLLKKFLEEKYFPKVNYLTTSSEEIKKKYASFFPNLAFHTILNVFSKTQLPLTPKQHNERALKLFWFSQSVGLARGLQDVIEALKILENEDIEFHILGFLSSSVKSAIDLQVKSLGFIREPIIIFHKPIASTMLTGFASKFDIGLATEPGFSINNDIALSNKIFTYIQAGLAIIASDTTAQKQFILSFPTIGMVYEKKNAMSLASKIKNYLTDKALLSHHQLQAAYYANEKLNWEIEKEKFLSIVNDTLSTS